MGKKILSALLSMAMIIGLCTGGTTTTKAAETKSVIAQVASLMDVSDATATGTVSVDITSEEVASNIYYVLKDLHFNSSTKVEYSVYDSELGKNVRTEAGKAFDDKMSALGVVKSYDAETNSCVYLNDINAQIEFTSKIVDSQNFTITLAAKVNNAPKTTISTVSYNNGNVTIDLQAAMKFVADLAGITTKQAYEYLELPAVTSLSLDAIAELNNYLSENVKLPDVKSFTVYTQEDGEEFAEAIGTIKDEELGEESKTVDFKITSAQLIGALQTVAKLVVNVADSSFQGYETTVGTKTTFNVNKSNVVPFVKTLGNVLINKSDIVGQGIVAQVKSLPEINEIINNYPAGYMDAQTKGLSLSIKKIGKNLNDIATDVTDEEQNTTNPLKQIIESTFEQFSVSLSSDIKGEKGYRDATFAGDVIVTENMKKTSKMEESEEQPVQDKVLVSFNVNIKENGEAPKEPVTTPTPAVTNGTVVKVGTVTYKVTSTKDATVELIAVKNTKTVVVPATVKINNKVYKVTTVTKRALKNCKKTTKVVIGKNIKIIGKNAFANCKKVKLIVINSKKIKKINKNAFKGVNSKVVIKCPKTKLKKYKKMLMKASVGYKKTWRIKSK